MDRFWTWSGMTPEEYARDRGYGEWEVDYPYWTELSTCFQKAIKAVNEGNSSEILVNLMLDAIAIDNEVESLLHDCEMELENNELELLIRCSITYIQPEARWQIASMIARRQNKDWEKYLYVFINDSHKYTQRRALIALSSINLATAVSIAQDKIKDDDEYMRFASLTILQEATVDNMIEIIESLKNDSSSIIRERVKAILDNGHNCK